MAEPDLVRWSRQLQGVQLQLGQELQGRGEAAHAYFPTTAIVSLLHTLGSASAEAGMVGREGVVGVPIFLGGSASDEVAIVRHAGWSFRVEAGWLRSECRANGHVQDLLLRYARSLIAQMARAAICNRHHTLPQQLSRRLLWCLDCIDGNELDVTHEQVARMLGVRRSGVSESAIRLQQLGAIRCARGRITVLERVLLEQQSCGCYRALADEYERLFV